MCFQWSSFSNNRGVNKHNCHHYAQNNPRWIREGHFQRVYSTSAWYGILGNKILGSSFFHERLNGQVYLNFLRNILPMLLEEVDLQRRLNMWLQQNGAPPYFHTDVRHYSDSVYANRWIGRGSINPWPSRSPDTTRLNYFFWGIVKDRVYQTPINNREELEHRITVACTSITPAMLMSYDSYESEKIFLQPHWRMRKKWWTVFWTSP